MIDTDKYEGQRVYLEHITVDIFEDDYENGVGESTGCGYSDAIGKSFASIDDANIWLANHYFLDDFEDDDGRLYTSKMVADHTDAQNGGWMKPTDDEVKAWRKGEMKLYCEDYSIYYHVIAPDLLAEVKRLREEIKDYDACLQNLWDRELIPEDTDIWDEVKELLEVD